MKHKMYYIINTLTNKRMGTTTFDLNSAYVEKSRLLNKLGRAQDDSVLEIKEVISTAISKKTLSDDEITTLENKVLDTLFDTTAKIISPTPKSTNKSNKKSK